MPRKKKRREGRGGDGVRKRKDMGGRFEVQFSYVDPETGKRRRFRKLLRTTDHDTAVQERADLMRAKRKDRPEPLPGVTLAHIKASYLKAHELQKDYPNKRHRVGKIVKASIGSRPLDDLGVEDYEAFQRSILGKAKGAKLLSRKATCNRYMMTVKHMIRWGVEHEKIPEVALVRVLRVRNFKEGKGRIHFFYKRHVARLLEALGDEEADFDGFMQPLVLLALGTGIRQGDLLRLKWGDVDETAGLIHVGGETGKETKGGTAYAVDVGGIADLGLELARQWLDANRAKADPDDYVIDWRSRDRVLKLLKRQFPRAAKAAKLDPHLTFHCLRHSFATWTLASGENLANVKAWMGHADITTTDRYLHALPKKKKKKLDIVNPIADKSDKPFRKKCHVNATNVVSVRVRKRASA